MTDYADLAAYLRRANRSFGRGRTDKPKPNLEFYKQLAAPLQRAGATFKAAVDQAVTPSDPYSEDSYNPALSDQRIMEAGGTIAGLMPVAGLAGVAPRGAMAANLIRKPSMEAYRREVGQYTPEQQPFWFHITDDAGKDFGKLTGHIEGDNAHVNMIGKFSNDRYGAEQANQFGARELRDLMKKFREIFPNVKSFSGNRVTGARTKAGGTDVSVPLPGSGGTFSKKPAQTVSAPESNIPTDPGQVAQGRMFDTPEAAAARARVAARRAERQRQADEDLLRQLGLVDD